MASYIEKELYESESDSENQAANGIGAASEVVFQVSLRPEALEELFFLHHLMRPILLSYYHLIGYLQRTRLLLSSASIRREGNKS